MTEYDHWLAYVRRFLAPSRFKLKAAIGIWLSYLISDLVARRVGSALYGLVAPGFLSKMNQVMGDLNQTYNVRKDMPAGETFLIPWIGMLAASLVVAYLCAAVIELMSSGRSDGGPAFAAPEARERATSRIVRVALWVLAPFGLFYIGTLVLVTVIASRAACELRKISSVTSADGVYTAAFEQSICPTGVRRSEGTVAVADAATPKQSVIVLKLAPTTTDVAMTWTGNRKLEIAVPKSVEVFSEAPSAYEASILVRHGDTVGAQ